MLVWISTGDELQHLRAGHQALLGRLLAEDGDPRLQVRWLDVGDQTPAETTAQPRLQVLQELRRPVGGHHDLLLGVVQGVEGVEELLLGLLLALQELDVVNQQDVHVAVALPKLRALVLTDGVDEVVGQFFGGDVADPDGVEVAAYVVAQGVQQVRLAQPGVAVDGERVVGLTGAFRHGDRGGMSKPVGAADDEGLEGVLRVQPGVRGAPGAEVGAVIEGTPSQRWATVDHWVGIRGRGEVDVQTTAASRSAIVGRVPLLGRRHPDPKPRRR